MPHRISPVVWRPQGEIEELEPNADKAVRSSRHCAVTAGPGAGKTELLAQRACYLLQTGECPAPQRILAISFKFDAAKNLRERVAERCHPELARRFESYTFAAFSMQLLAQGRLALPSWCRPTDNFEPLLRPSFKRFVQQPPGVAPGTPKYSNIQRLDLERLKRKYFHGPLPLSGFNHSSLEEEMAALWWKDCLESNPSRLTFDMMTRLAELLSKTTTAFRNALRSTYSHIFLDEFQDTNEVQYDFVKTAFGDSSAVLTAVGDDKQHIMGFAGALSDAFERFQAEYNALDLPLEWNFRSSPDLVKIQQVLAQSIDPHAPPATSMTTKDISQDACEIISCATEKEEAKFIAREVTSTIQEKGLRAGRFAVIVRQKSGAFLPELKKEFEKRDLKIRNESQVQDLMSQRLTQVLISFLRLGAHEHPGYVWHDCMNVLSKLWRVVGQDSSEMRIVDRKLESFHQKLLQQLAIGPAASQEALRSVIDEIISFIGPDWIRAEFAEYRKESQFEHWLDKFASYLAEVGQSHDDWDEALDEVEGLDTTPVMTLYKSKGLEYHTVFFVGLEDNTWWTLTEQPEDTMRQFFVAFSRAEQRVVFTNCRSRDTTHDVDLLYQLLKRAGVTERPASNILS